MDKVGKMDSDVIGGKKTGIMSFRTWNVVEVPDTDMVGHLSFCDC